MLLYLNGRVMAWAPKWRIAACEGKTKLKRRTRTRDVRHRPRGTGSEEAASLWPLGGRPHG